MDILSCINDLRLPTDAESCVLGASFVLLVSGLGEVLQGGGGESSAVVVTVGAVGVLVGSESGCELIGGLVLVESTSRGVPGLGGLASSRPIAESVDDSVGWVAAGLSATDVGVVLEPAGDVFESGFENGSLAVGVLGSGELAVDALQLILKTNDVGLSVTDLVGENFDGVSGVGDSVFATSAAERPVMEVEIRLSGLQPFPILSEAVDCMA